MWIGSDPFSIIDDMCRALEWEDSSLMGDCPVSEFPAELRSAAVSCI